MRTSGMRYTLTSHQGPITNRLGYRLTTLLALVLMNATIFISFFVSITEICSQI
jgi:hypothetical protein